ncbi:glycosyl transferase, partial [Flavobacterium sp. HMWF030]
MQSSSFSILITTKNRKEDLAFTLLKIQHLLDRSNVECVVFDDGSID